MALSRCYVRTRILSQLVGRASEQSSLLCLVASHMGLVQQEISVVLYGNSTTKQVCDLGLPGFL